MEGGRREVTPLVFHSANDLKLLAAQGKRHYPDEIELEKSPASPKKKKGKGSAGKIDNTASTKKSQQEQLSLQYHPTMEPINEDSNGSLMDEFSIFGEIDIKQQLSKPEEKRISNRERVDAVHGCLVREVSVVSPFRIRCLDFAEQLLTYRFEKPKKIFSSEPHEKHMRNLHYTFNTIESLYRLWRQDTARNEFYLFCGKHTLYLTRHQKNPQVPVLLLHSDNDCVERTLRQEALRYHSHSESPLYELFSLYGGNIGLFYKHYAMDMFKRELPFEVIANFKFDGCSEHLPRQIFNGPENREFYSYLLQGAKKQTVISLFGEKTERKRQLYLSKFEGCFLRENLLGLLGRLEMRGVVLGFELYCEPLKQTEQFAAVLRASLPVLWDGTTTTEKGSTSPTKL